MRTTRESLDLGVSKPARRGGARAAPKARETGRVGLDLLVALFLASAIYVGFGGALASEVTPLLEAQALTLADAAHPADAGSATTDDDTSSGSATLPGYLLAGYVPRSRDDEEALMPDGHE